ncbi:DUF4274 domain-containing protein [Chryseobacterium sp. RLHN22]|uniref:DUF4274 domain-containing protein n=1 Tax=Chryseobacterium sp. RLHN22 TaxID=3437885 RepID=UPI003D9BA109
MKEITQERKQFIDDNFYEGIDENKLNKSKFELLTSPYELQYLAEKHNWDNGIKILQWISESNICSEATALQLFWLSQPKDYQSYKLTETIKGEYVGDKNDIFQLIKTILNNFENGFYKKTDIHFDPTIHMEAEPQVPDIMKEATNGEETYIYLEKSDVDSWFGEILENKIKRCDTTMELYNIASFVKNNFNDKAELILKHPLCDKGIALMLFWRLKTHTPLWYSADTILNQIIKKIQNCEYPEIVAYNPKLDSEIKMKEPKPKWTIPEFMIRPI